MEFSFQGSGGETGVSLVGDFNGWSGDEDRLTPGEGGIWRITRTMRPGVYQYLFLVDGREYVRDAGNPASVENYNASSRNSVFVLTEDFRVLLSPSRDRPLANPGDVYPPAPDAGTLYLNIVWHQHQPLYVNPETDELRGPWVRTHATKDYYDMAAILRRYPDIHCTINLTSSLLHQLQEYYVDRLRPFVDARASRVDASGFLAAWKGRTDPWIDLALTPAEEFRGEQIDLLYRNAWNAFGISEVQIGRFPAYAGLKKRWESAGDSLAVFSVQEMREIKFWFYAAHFDPDFLRGPVPLPGGGLCNLSDVVEERSDGTFHVRVPVTEDLCNRMVAEAWKVMAAVVPVHRELMGAPGRMDGQIEVITTPFYHPILPLVYDSDLARICQGDDVLPPRFSYPADADAQVEKAVRMYRSLFGAPPLGMWPGEGALAQEVLGILARHGILWTATDVKVLQRSEPSGRPNTTPYGFSASAGREDGTGKTVAVVFRDTDLSDRIGFKYQNETGEEAAEDFVRSLLSMAPRRGGEDVLITVILDGENAWEWYRKDNDGKQFLNAFYRKLSVLHAGRRIVTVTTAEYLGGNPARGVPPHPLERLPRMDRLWPGSWINANYDTWVGEPEENRAWEYLLRARQDLELSGLPQPDPSASPPGQGTPAWHAYRAWEAMYAAEGSDWFWWYGADQTAPAGEQPFDDAFRTHLENVYRFAALAGSAIRSPGFDPVIRQGHHSAPGQGAMARSTRMVRFVCDVRAVEVPTAVYIVGNRDDLGAWTPNAVAMRDDGSGGDAVAGDGFWTLEISVPLGEGVEYKYTNSGARGQWVPGEEFPSRHRSVVVAPGDGVQIVQDVFGK
ncbi:MAG: carbohydrate-binding module family 20 domain-containing protein [Bacteroidota bacterium]